MMGEVMASINYSKLTLKDALDAAIIIEDEAKDRYQELAEQLEEHHTHEAAEFFRFMVDNEKKHGDDLRKQRKAMFRDEPREITAAQVPEVETSDYDTARAFMSAHQALRVAMANEVRAHDFYDDALKHVTDSKIRSLFAELRAEEVDHKKQIEKVLAKLGPEGTADPNDFVDEPTAQ